MLKKLIVASVVVSALLFTVLAWWLSAPNGEEGPNTTGLPMKIVRRYWPGTYWIEIADKKGWFREAGLNVELVDGNPDYCGSLQDMVDGKVDVNGFSLFDVISYNAAGADLVLVINCDISSGSEAIVARPSIETITDLRGKTIGVASNSYTEYILDFALNRYGLSSADVIKVAITDEKAAEEFGKGALDAIATWEPVVSEAIEKWSGRKLFDTSEASGLSPNGQVFHRSFIEARPGDVQAYVNVWHKATRYIKEHPHEAFAIIADIYSVTPSEVAAFERLDRVLSLRENHTTFSYGAGFESLHGSARKMNDFLIDKGVIVEHLDSTQFLDATFINTLSHSLRRRPQ
ncbi:MAG: ABC transporter substrate-binding protein [Candidatus Sedimenticola sp. (ex Thyasira tokunagai)]